jgi:hypothetical protein
MYFLSLLHTFNLLKIGCSTAPTVLRIRPHPFLFVFSLVRTEDNPLPLRPYSVARESKGIRQVGKIIPILLWRGLIEQDLSEKRAETRSRKTTTFQERSRKFILLLHRPDKEFHFEGGYKDTSSSHHTTTAAGIASTS